MDFEQWKNHQQLEMHAKAPKFSSNLSALPGMGSLFSWAQRQELELQALIYHYMMTEASVPLDLILHLKNSFFSSSPCYHYQHFQPSMQTGYWGKYIVDPEPGRCRRTDGKKWRCSRDVVAGKKYCDRHVHRGRTRSRKHVEISPTHDNAAATLSAFKENKQTCFAKSETPPTLDIFNQRTPADKVANRCLQKTQYLDFSSPELKETRKSDTQVLMRFFDDNSRSEQESTSCVSYPTNLSISIPENSLSDFSLKLSTGNINNLESNNEEGSRDWCASSMGGPLAEALRSSISTSSPSSVLQKHNGSASEASSLTV